ncbi:hypothetical protein TWF696_007260 [Orbilia brochopaga]|uniref:WD40 repeat-like protein n=1 Tax=Orbilia brochopaga TaxID=3140254 RepID=A0AAV9USR2_9PEZI
MSKRHHSKSSRHDGPSKTDWKVIVTTATKVNVWNGVNERFDTVFTSGTEGIVSAKLAKEGNVLAVAGSQVVLLHKIEKGQQQSYKLKGADATRLLEYAADGKSIFLNSSIRNSIQTYNVRDDKIAESLKPHPSPVTCFATSLDSTLILSASENPPTIHIDNLGLRTTTHLKPRASDGKVILSAFHPTRKNVFLLAFADGVLAAYDYSKASKSGNHIHAFGHLHDAMMGGNGITAAEFIPGSQTKAITAGEDGRCMLLDFDKRDVVASFHIGAPATCISVRGEEGGKRGSGKWMVAVGTLHGWCYIYDHNGNRLHEAQVDRDGNKVLEVKWKFGDIKLPITAPAANTAQQSPRKASSSLPISTARTPQALKHKPTLPAQTEEPIIPAEKPPVPLQFPESPKVSRVNANKPLPKPPPTDKTGDSSWEDDSGDFKEQKPAWEDLQNTYTADYMSIFSPVKNEQALRNSPRRSARLSIRSATSPPKGGEDRIEALIKQDEEGLLRPSISSPSLAMSKPRTPGKKKPGATALPRSVKKHPAKQERKVEVEATAPPPDVQEVKPQVPAKNTPKPEPPIARDFAIQPAPSLPSVPPTDNKAVEDFRKVRAKLESGQSHHVLSLFSSHMPNQKPKPQSSTSLDSADGKENSSVAPTVDMKTEKKKVKSEEKQRRRSAREEKKRKKKDGSFPAVSDLVFKDDDMDIDAAQPAAAEPPMQYLDLPSIPSSKIGSTKRKATDDPYDVPSSSAASKQTHALHVPHLVKGKEKAKTPVADDIWIPEEVRKPSKRVNVGEGTSMAAAAGDRAASQPPFHDGTMSIHDMIADLKTAFKEEMAALKSDIQEKFDRQNEFFENLVNGERSEVRSLRDENERLKAEIEELVRFGSR